MTAISETGIRTGNRWTPLIWSVAGGLILLPFVAMRFTREVNWTAEDFVFAGIMIGGACIVLELALRLTRSWAYRGGVVFALAAIFLLVWINAAVGIIGSEGNAANLVYGCVIMTAIGGAIGAGLRAAGMARAAAAAAGATIVVGLLVVTSGRTDPPGVLGYAMLHLFFAALFATSAMLFRKAARAQG